MKNIIHQKTGKIIEKVEVCDTPATRARGLMFSVKKSLLFCFEKEQDVYLHMLFVFFPIDVFFLNKNKEIIEIKRNFLPFSWYHSKKKCMYFIEVPRITGKEDINEGDTFIW